MARATKGDREGGGSVISIVGPGMRVSGDLVAEGTIRIEGDVRGTIFAGKAVVIGKEGKVKGEISTQDAVISGTVDGTIVSASRLEIQATAVVDGQIRTRRMQLEEGAMMNAEVEMGEVSLEPPEDPGPTGDRRGSRGKPEAAQGKKGASPDEADPDSASKAEGAPKEAPSSQGPA
jgi:cytoskeletal protein CcmA (bactofilin family)